MTRKSDRNEDRYQRAVARITPQRREQMRERVLVALGLVAWPTEAGKIIGAERLMAHKLGERFAQS